MSADVPLIVSTTLDERAYRETNFDQTWAGVERRLRAVVGDDAEHVLDAYQTVNDFIAVSETSGFDFRTGVGGGGAGPAPIPEPATWAVMIIGFGLTGSTLRRSAKTAVARA